MQTRREILKWSVGALAGLAVQLPGRASADLQGSLAVVVAKNSPLVQLSLFELKKLYLGAHLTDPSGEKIVPFNHVPRSVERVAFDGRVLGMTPDEVTRYWIDRKIRGEAGAPKAVSADLLQRVVSRLAHSVAYVKVSELHPDVRAISIDGRIPGETGYGLFA